MGWVCMSRRFVFSSGSCVVGVITGCFCCWRVAHEKAVAFLEAADNNELWHIPRKVMVMRCIKWAEQTKVLLYYLYLIS